MEQKIDVEKPTQKIYKDKAIWVGTFLGGPLIAGYLIAENFKAFGDLKSAKKTRIYTIIVTLIILVGVLLIPEDIDTPNSIIPILCTLTAYYLVQNFQGQNISSHINSDGQFFGWWRVVAVGMIGLALTLLSIVILAILLGVA